MGRGVGGEGFSIQHESNKGRGVGGEGFSIQHESNNLLGNRILSFQCDLLTVTLSDKDRFDRGGKFPLLLHTLYHHHHHHHRHYHHHSNNGLLDLAPNPHRP